MTSARRKARLAPGGIEPAEVLVLVEGAELVAQAGDEGAFRERRPGHARSHGRDLADRLRTQAHGVLRLAGKAGREFADSVLRLCRLAEAFIYLAVVLDAFSRKVVGWAMADHLRASLALDALEMALASREVITGGLVHHADRGVQYACGDYIARLEAAGVQPSMSRAGCPYDNAMAESFMKTLKHEEVDASAYRDLAHARAAIGEIIETAYNRQRLHSALAYLSPVEFESNQPWAAAQQPGAVTQPSCP